MADDYSCQHAPCARHLPRRTAYCPYCGTRQSAATLPLRKGTAAPAPAASTPAAAAPTPAAAHASTTAAPASAAAASATSAAAPRPAPTKIPPFVAPAPKRKPWWRWPLVWLAFVGIGALIGKSQRPADAIQSKVEAIDTLIQDCKLERARQDLPALRKLDANQARSLQVKIDQAKAQCDDKRGQTKPDHKPSASAKPPRPASATSEQNAQRVADLQVEALFDLGGGNYKGAADKMTQCLARLEPGNARCIELKQQAERLNKERARCLKAGREWSDDKCAGADKGRVIQ